MGVGVLHILLDTRPTAADLCWFGDGVKTCCLIAGLVQITDFVAMILFN
jgi:hypothetical protein